MNLRLFSMALLISALPLHGRANSTKVSFDRGDFLSAERLSRDGESIVGLKLKTNCVRGGSFATLRAIDFAIKQRFKA